MIIVCKNFLSSYIVIFTQIFVNFFLLIPETVVCLGLLFNTTKNWHSADFSSFEPMVSFFLFKMRYIVCFVHVPFICVLRVLFHWKRQLVRTSLHLQCKLDIRRAVGCS